MEASQQGAENQDPTAAAANEGEGTQGADGGQVPDPALAPGQAPDPTAHEAEHSGDAVGESFAEGAEPDSDERNPAADQAPVATEAQETIIGDPGLRDEQQPLGNEGGASNVNTPHRTSAPPPAMQSGTPLPEDRAAEAAGEGDAENE